MVTKRKGRPPKCPPGVARRWTKAFGWRFRAFPMVQAKRICGPWREHADEAAKDAREIRERGKQAAEVAEFITFSDALDLFLDRAVERGFRTNLVQPCRPATVTHYTEICGTLRRLFGTTVPLVKVDATIITAYLEKRRTERVVRCKCQERGTRCTHTPVTPSPARLNKERLVLRLVFKTAIDAGQHPGPNPVDAVDRYAQPQSQRAEEDEFYTPDQIAEVITAVRGRADTCMTAEKVALVVQFLYLSGCRLGELVHLRGRNIDLRHGILRVPVEGKTGTRKVPMSKPLLAVCTALADGLHRDNHIWRAGETNRDTVKHDLKRNVFPRWRKRLPADLRARFHAHTFRHSWASQLEAEGVPERRINQLGGWSDRGNVARGYRHAQLQRLRQDMADGFDHLEDPLEPADLTADAATAS